MSRPRRSPSKLLQIFEADVELGGDFGLGGVASQAGLAVGHGLLQAARLAPQARAGSNPPGEGYRESRRGCGIQHNA